MLVECAAPLPTEPISSPPDGHDYRRLARQIRDLARQTRLQYRGPSCFGSPLITTGAAITSTGEPSRSAPAGAEARRRPSTGRPGSPRPPCPGPRSYPCAAAARSRLSRRRERASRPTRSSPHPTTLCRYSRPEVRHLPRPPAD